MQSTRRVAIPLRVHQIWDAIGRFGGTQVMDFEKLVEVVTSMHKVPRGEYCSVVIVSLKGLLHFPFRVPWIIHYTCVLVRYHF